MPASLAARPWAARCGSSTRPWRPVSTSSIGAAGGRGWLARRRQAAVRSVDRGSLPAAPKHGALTSKAGLLLAIAAATGGVVPPAAAPGRAGTVAGPPIPALEATIATAVRAAERRLAARLPQLPGGARAEAIGELAMIYHAQARLPEAIATYRRALAEAPSLQWRYLLGVALSDHGDLDAAIAAYEASARLAPGDGLANYRLGAALLLRGDPQAAGAALGQALAAMPDSPAVLAALGAAAAAAGDLPTARRHLERAAALAPSAGRIAYRLGVVLRELGHPLEAERWLARRNDLAPTLADPRLLAVGERSLSPRFFLTAGNRAKTRGHWDEALAAFERAAALAPADVAIALARADALGALDHLDAALAAADEVIARDPDAAAAWLLRAFLLQRRDRLPEALAAAERGVALDPDRAGRTLLAALHMRAKSFPQAARDYEALAAEFSDQAYFRYWLAMARFGDGDCAGGRPAMAAALALRPQWGEAHIASCRAAALCGHAGELAAVRQRAGRLHAAADTVETRLTVAFVDLRTGRSAAARDAASAALPHSDARMLLDAIDDDTLPRWPFAPTSAWWVPPELAARPATKTP